MDFSIIINNFQIMNDHLNIFLLNLYEIITFIFYENLNKTIYNCISFVLIFNIILYMIQIIVILLHMFCT